MICVTRVKVNPGIIYMKTGQAYTDAIAQVSPPEATNPSVKWSSSNRKVVDVHPYNGSMLGIGEGTATVYATAQDDSGKKGCCTVVVSKRISVRNITLSFTDIDLGTNVDYSLPAAKISPDSADNQTVRWCSDNPDVATIKNGRIYTHSEGKATITAAATDGSGVSASCKVTVYKMIYVSSVTLNESSKVMRVGESMTLKADVCPDNATNRGYMWVSSDESIATVNPASGLVIAQSPGTTTIQAESVDGSGKKGVCTVTVKAGIPVDSITFDRTDVFLRPGDRYEIFKVICPSNATNKSLLWTSTNPDVASVNNGMIRAKSNGVTTIIAIPADGGGKQVEATCSVWVSDYTPVSSVTVSPSSKTMTVEDSITLHALVCPDNATHKQLMWKSSNEAVATVRSDSGVVFAQGPGTAIIWAMTMEGMGVFGSCQVTVKAAVPVRSVKVCPEETSISVGESACLTATISPRGATNKSVRWSSDRPDIATVSKTGTGTATVTGRSDGTATITAMTADGGFVSSCRVTVDSREVVYIEEDGKNPTGSKCFKVRFSNGLIWKNINYDLSDKGLSMSALEAEIKDHAQKRYDYNSTKEFCEEQLAFIYLVDPLGVEYYVKNIGPYKMNTLNRLLFIDRLYKMIFGVKPRFFEKLFDGTAEECSYAVTEENREDVYSSAEVLFGSHNVWNWDAFGHAILNPLANWIKDSLFGFFQLPDYLSEIMGGIQEYQGLFYSASVNENIFNGAAHFFEKYGEYVYANGMSEMFNAIGVLIEIWNIVNDSLVPPDFQDITIYKKIDTYNYNTRFRIDGSDISMKEIIARCTTN